MKNPASARPLLRSGSRQRHSNGVLFDVITGFTTNSLESYYVCTDLAHSAAPRSASGWQQKN